MAWPAAIHSLNPMSGIVASRNVREQPVANTVCETRASFFAGLQEALAAQSLNCPEPL
jgi:hypothetical protein